MELRDYCEISRIELEELKARVHDMFSKFEKMSSSDREKFGPISNELETIIKEIDDRIDQLQRECPSEWNLQRNELDVKFSRLKKTLEEALGKVPPEAFIG